MTVSGMYLQPPSDEPPDLVVEGSFKCGKCGLGWSNVRSTWPAASLWFQCFCGITVEILPTTHIDGSPDAQE